MSTAPRIGTARSDATSLGPLLAEVAERMGLELHDWQALLSDVSLELVERHKPGTELRLAAGNVGAVVGRQSGKTSWVAARVAMQALLPDLEPPVGGHVQPQRCAYTAQDRIAALGRWYEHVDLICAHFGEHVANVKRKNGEECLYFANGSTYRVVTPSRTGARGLSLDLAVIDEALAHDRDLLAAIRPTMAQRDGATGCIGAQLVLVSNAGDDTSTLLNTQRELGRRAVATGDRTRVWMEWSAPDDADPFDEAVWAATVPTLEQPNGISVEFLRSEAESMTPDDFAREYLCVHRARPQAHLIDLELWAQAPHVAIPDDAPVAFAVDADRDRTQVSVVAAARVGGVVAVEVLEQRAGTGWVADYLAEVAARNWSTIVVDTYGPMANLIPYLERMPGVVLRPVKVGEVVDGAAMFVDAVATGRLGHRGDPRLDDAVASAGRRKVGDRWAFSRAGVDDISPLVAASLATWCIETDNVLVPGIS